MKAITLDKILNIVKSQSITFFIEINFLGHNKIKAIT